MQSIEVLYHVSCHVTQRWEEESREVDYVSKI